MLEGPRIRKGAMVLISDDQAQQAAQAVHDDLVMRVDLRAGPVLRHSQPGGRGDGGPERLTGTGPAVPPCRPIRMTPPPQ